MNTQSRQNEHQERQKEELKQTDQQRPRLNPRLVFGDPDKFFRDLLMEQQEQS